MNSVIAPDDPPIKLVDPVVPREDLLGAHRLALDERVERVAEHLLRLLPHRLQVAADAVLRRPVLLFRALGDVDGLVADALEIRHEPQRAGEEAQVVGHGLPEREDAKDQRVDVHLVAIDVPVELLDLRGELRRTLPEGLERELQPALAAAPPSPASARGARAARTRNRGWCARRASSGCLLGAGPSAPPKRAKREADRLVSPTSTTSTAAVPALTSARSGARPAEFTYQR